MHKELTEILRGELIGRTISIPSKKITGKIINETKNMIVIFTGNKEKKMIEKKTNIFQIYDEGRVIDVKGSLIIGRSEDRISKRIARNW